MRSGRLRVVMVGVAVSALVALTIGVGANHRAADAATAAAIPVGQPMTGSMTFYNDAGFGACGTRIDAATEDLVAVPFQWFTAVNPNNDPLCQGISVQVTVNGTTITVPVKDKCPSCDATHIDLSQPAFARLAPLSVGVVTGITWKFIGNPGTPSPRVVPTPTPTRPGGGSAGCAPAWNPNTSYVPGDAVSFGGHAWTATYFSTGAPPGDPASWAVWRDGGACG